LAGVVVRHPDVFALHAVGSGKEGQFLVTESAPAVPLPEWLLRRALLPAEATALGIRLARILQGFHEQGFIHGRLSAEWIMLHGELEPLLCPCGIPSQSIQARQKDLMALGRLLNEWLFPRPAKWQRQARADLYRVADAAAEGKYVRARSLADDLERADRAAQIRWRVPRQHPGPHLCPDPAAGLRRRALLGGVALVRSASPSALESERGLIGLHFRPQRDPIPPPPPPRLGCIKVLGGRG
jgi:hypothetical protein